MEGKKIIAIAGATGAQGGGLARAILNDPNSEFSVRALTRDPNSEKAQALKAMGAEVVAADLDDPQSVRAAFEGAYGAFCVTFFWNHFSPETELAQAKVMAEAAKAAGVKHVIWSTLEDTRNWVKDDSMPTLMEKYKVPHFDAKGEADELFRSNGVPTTFLLTSFYWDNFIHFGLGPQAGPDGKLALTLPMGDTKLPGIAAEDIGRAAYGIFKRPELIGNTVGIMGESLTGADMAAGLSRVTGKEIGYNAVPPDVFRSFGFPGADDLGNMFQFKADFNDEYNSRRDVNLTRELNPQLQSFSQWAEANKAAF